MFHPRIHIDAGVAPIETLITFGALSVGKPLKEGKGGRVSGWMKISLRELPDRFRIVLNKPFFDKLLLDEKNKMGTWEKLAEKFGITYGSLVDLRNGEANQDVSFSRYRFANGLCGFRWCTKKRVGR